MWHPTHYADSDGKDSQYADHLAVASNEKDVHVSEIKFYIFSLCPKFQIAFCFPQIFDLSDILSKKEGEETTVASSDETETSTSSSSSSPLVTSPLVTLSGHLLRVISLAWSPHEEGKLASVSYDGTAQVTFYVLYTCKPQ